MAGRNDNPRGRGYRDRMTREARQYREDVANNSILSGTYDTLASFLPEQSAAGATRLADYFMPFYGGAATIEEGADTLRDAHSLGDYLLGGGQVALGAAEFAPIVGALAKGGRGARFLGDEAGAIRAWHGSPHDFDKFDMNKIGTGEGAQAYGHGLYFAENDAVAKGYRDQIAGRITTQRVMVDGQEYIPPTEAHQRAAAIIAKDGRGSAYDVLNAGIREGYMDDETQKAYREVLKLTAKKDVQPMTTGRLYEVEIDANPEDFLDWDAPLSEQPEGVRRVWDEFLASDRGAYADEGMGGDLRRGAGQYADPTGKDLYGAWSEATPHNPNDMFDYSRNFTGDMREAGIPGIRYYDQGSRTAGEGTRNYVVFDDSLISILRKLGLAGTAPLGAILAGQNEGQ